VPLTDALCTHCGLCCDGTLFADLALTGVSEARRMEDLGLRLDEDSDEGAIMLLPCAGLRGTRCSVYAYRPKCCSTFECHLLLDARRGAVTVDAARKTIDATRAQVARVRALLARLGDRRTHLPLRERCAELLASEPPESELIARRREELAQAMAQLETAVRGSFLGRV
jgi:hypothetical protein